MNKSTKQSTSILETFLVALGIPKKDLLAHHLIKHFGSLQALCYAAPSALLEVSGVTENLATTLTYLPRIGAALLEEKLDDVPVVDHMEHLKNLFFMEFANENSSYYGAVFLDRHHHMITRERLFRGNTEPLTIYPKEIAKAAMAYRSRSVITAQNCPLGFRKDTHFRKGPEPVYQALGHLEIHYKAHLVIEPRGVSILTREEDGWFFSDGPLSDPWEHPFAFRTNTVR